MSRVFLLVMDSAGIGGAPDAAAYGDEGADTLGHIAEAAGPLRLPALDSLGLGAAAREATGRVPAGLSGAGGCWAAAREWSRGKDTPSGHWELAGRRVAFDWGYFPREDPAFPADLVAALCAEARLPGVLGQIHSNGMAAIERWGPEHVRTGKPICYTSADSVFQIAAHEEAFGLDRLYEVCAVARRLCDPLRIGRVIARPFLGAPGAYRRTANRKDYAIPPPEGTLPDRAKGAGRAVVGIGKIGDIFAHRGLTAERKGANDMALFDALEAEVATAPGGALVFANFVEFDSLYGHMRDPAGYARALEAFDARLGAALPRLRDGDLLIVTADHGNDPTWEGTDHTREMVPALFASPGLPPRALGRCDFADIGATAAAWLGLPPGKEGRSLL